MYENDHITDDSMVTFSKVHMNWVSCNFNYKDFTKVEVLFPERKKKLEEFLFLSLHVFL